MVPIVLVIAVITFIAWWLFPEPLRPILGWGDPFLSWLDPDANRWLLGILASLAVMVSTCAGTLRGATPIVLMVSSALGANRGIFIRDGRAIATLQTVKTVVFIKPGPLPKHNPN